MPEEKEAPQVDEEEGDQLRADHDAEDVELKNEQDNAEQMEEALAVDNQQEAIQDATQSLSQGQRIEQDE